jgi:protein ImuB
LPRFPTDRLRRCHAPGHPTGAPPADTPFITAAHDGHRRVIAAVDAAARALGLRPGLPLAQAQARIPGLAVLPAEPEADAAALARLAAWCLRYAPLTRRFSTTLLRRLDQALGHIFEPIVPLDPPALISRRLPFVEPLFTAEAFTTVIARLTRSVCRRLDHAGLGARRLDLLFERVDGSIQAIRVGTARPTRDPAHLARLLDERLETVAPGPGVEAMRLTLSLVEPFAPTQTAMAQEGMAQTATLLDDAAPPDLSVLLDRLANRLGAARIYRIAPIESDVPERAVRRISPLSAPTHRTWPADLPRPTRLLSPPQQVQALAPLPDHPPVAFTWRRKRFHVRRADGPERIHGEWWRRDAETLAVRDYFQVEDADGNRFWLFRRGDGIDAATGDLSWFLHGIF